MLDKTQIIDRIKNHSPQKYYTDKLYYQGDNTSILTAPKKRKPDNRIPIAFVNRLIKNLSGYAARPADIYIEYEGDETDSDFVSEVQNVYSKNYEYIVNSKLYKSVLKYGLSYDVVWTERNEITGEVIVKFSDIPIEQCIPIWDSNLSSVPTLSELIRVYKANGQSYVTHYFAGGYRTYTYKDENGSIGELMLQDEIAQPFSTVQVSVYQCNDEQISYWQPVRAIIDEFDKVMSKSSNEVDRFNDTWIAFVNKIDPETKKKIDEMGVIDNLQNAIKEGVSDVFPRFLERNIPTEHTRLMMDKLEALIYTIMGVPNFLDETLGAASGISMLYRLIGLEYAAVETDTYFDIGLLNRNRLIEEAVDSLYNLTKPEGINEKVVHKRNLPLDVLQATDIAMRLKAIGLSNEAVLNYLPAQIVGDVQAELERLNETESIGTVEQLTNGNELSAV